MSDFMKADNVLVTCPYNVAHKVKASRLQVHIAKCKLDHLDMAKQVCPFNATHLVERCEFEHHLIHCPDKGVLDRHMAQSLDKNNPYKGRTALPPASSDPFIGDNEESWDLELESSPARPISSRPPPPGAVIEPPAMSKPSERKSFYQTLHKLHNDTEVKESVQCQPSIPRQPNLAEAKKQPDSRTIQNLGLGRGKSRIAANFNNLNSGPSYSNMVRDMKNLGLGRGQPSGQASVPALDDEDDFPALGCGRGALISPKQNIRAPGTKLEK